MYHKVLEKIASLKPCFSIGEKEIDQSLRNILQQDILAEIDMPPFDKSAMDGYACRREDLENELEMLEVIPAGKIPEFSLGINQCSKIMTGASLPENANCVFKVEDSKTTRDGFVACTDQNSKRNICNRAEDFKQGEILIKKGQIIRPEHIAVMASCGLQKVKVAKMPRIGIIITGSELLEPNVKMLPGKIRNSNGPQLISLLNKMGIESKYYGIAIDNLEILRSIFRQALEENDLVMVTGGASMGDFDLVPDILKEEGFELLWERTGLKPGNPMSFGIKGDKYFFGLSGNPVSSLVQFEYLAKPIIYQLLGTDYSPLTLKVPLAQDFKRKAADRLGVIPVLINSSGEIEHIPFNGSAHIASLPYGNALMEIPAGIFEIKKGNLAYVRPL